MAFVLIGFMGAGKSTVAGELAAALGGSALDSDALLAERFGHPVASRRFARRRRSWCAICSTAPCRRGIGR
jgi:shikimate kinase